MGSAAGFVGPGNGRKRPVASVRRDGGAPACVGIRGRAGVSPPECEPGGHRGAWQHARGVAHIAGRGSSRGAWRTSRGVAARAGRGACLRLADAHRACITAEERSVRGVRRGWGDSDHPVASVRRHIRARSAPRAVAGGPLVRCNAHVACIRHSTGVGGSSPRGGGPARGSAAAATCGRQGPRPPRPAAGRVRGRRGPLGPRPAAADLRPPAASAAARNRPGRTRRGAPGRRRRPGRGSAA